MKCIHCGRVSRLRERVDGRCPGCGHGFAFDPEARPGAGTDAEFKEAIDRASGGGQLRFSARQLWLAASGPLKPPPPPRPAAFFIVSMAMLCALPMLAIALFSGMPGMLTMAVVCATAAAGAAMGWGLAQDEMSQYADQLAPRRPFNVFVRYQLQPWLKVHGDIPGLLPPRDMDDDAAPRQLPAEVAGFDRAVVTDRWETAQMLIGNGFHLQHRCAVLSRDGYPDGTADAVREALRRTPRLTVFALHDASPDGCRLPLDLREPEWFPDPSVRVVDLGLRPDTVRRLKLPAVPGPSAPWPESLDGLLAHEDLLWLARGSAYELAAVPSAQLLRAAYGGMAAASPNDGSGGTVACNDACWTGVGVWFGASDGGGADTAADLAAVALAR